MKEKQYEVSLCRRDDDENFATTYVNVDWDNMITILDIFSPTHRITIMEIQQIY